jgi:molecular chaperone GrpE
LLFQESVEEILRRNGVEIFSVEQELFLPSKQRSLCVVATPDPAQDKQIAKRVRKGFEYEGKLLRPEIVETYKYS